MFWNKPKKRLVRVVITLYHGGHDMPDKGETIDVLPGQEFIAHYSSDCLWEGDTLVKEWDWRAGYTRKCEYFYV